MAEKKIVVVGAGVTGLTTALLLSRSAQYTVTVAAKHMPGDYDIEYASPWAGADFAPMNEEGSKEAEWERTTWPYLEQLARNQPEAGLHFQRSEHHHWEKHGQLEQWIKPWWSSLFPDFQEIPRSELREGFDKAIVHTTVGINTAIYLPWLVSQCLKQGVVFKRAVFQHINEASLPGVHHSEKASDVVVNCTGLSAAKLGGVNDKDMYPIRGQTVLVRNDPGVIYAQTGNDDSSDETTYIITRAAGGGTILGGCKQQGNWESQPDLNLAARIMKRTINLCPGLTEGRGVEHLDIIRHCVGLRPGRKGGVRIEREEISGSTVVHAYGHGGYGYQTSYGCAEKVVELVDTIFKAP